MLDIEPLLAFYKAKNGEGLPVLRDGGKNLRDFAGWREHGRRSVAPSMTAKHEKALKTARKGKRPHGRVIRAIRPQPRRGG
ncbi:MULTISPECIES: hypothetical protein [unclassified Novosphingobium]|uniref:hypothetical protein n=1 Tax=unclassified Novosphingobium TaxID=2644732 RepID=UPI001ACC1D5A|nr:MULTISPECIES: hypothetical protein [unclassified Novosphingobium]MBN9143238.1 hypothetical protein [Novosphingobium sp.]MDR6706326.1 hypothetical protein [Novosphingobium sp. 1748]